MPIGYRDPAERVRDYGEIWQPRWDEATLRAQGERCMDCGVPTSAGCPIGNLIPDWNDRVAWGDWRGALASLHATNNFPEFTGYTCPAPCENACTLTINDAPITIKDLERAIVDWGWAEGWIVPEPPARRTGYRAAVVGSGPAGLAAAQQLNRAGHRVTVFERDDAIGGLMTYGIPDFKFAKDKVARRVRQLAEEGIVFRTGVEIGRNLPLETLINEFDAIGLAIGAQLHREVALPGRALAGVHLGMDYLKHANRVCAGACPEPELDARDKRVVVLGGGDTGADCVATAHRQGAVEVMQISINEQPPQEADVRIGWPWAPQIYRRSYAQEEGGQEAFSINTLSFVETEGCGRVGGLRAERVEWQREDGRRSSKHVTAAGLLIPTDLVILAVGFAGAEAMAFEDFGIALSPRGTLQTDRRLATNLDGVFATGDARLGASLVVWAIGDGRDMARQVDLYLTGESRLPPSLSSRHPPLYPS